ncbi:NAD(P)-binding protein [Acrodontium crateriforme]|uniref:NAD(P)-binding protein n=1 Tax=Acrodontium crateriforme TaxID=150365 RepID=A0AAQ3M218_9PEZI|nr:NAD(P)-binding protein [Acrodontium crateriforme]
MPSNPLRRYQHGGDCWALVTGATNGMGEEYALQLAQLGFNLIIHGRNASKLDSVAARIKAKNPIADVRSLVIDASTSTHDLSELKKLLAEVRLTVLINNIGVVTQDYPLLEEQNAALIASQLSVNTLFPTVVAATALPVLKRNEPSLMINMSSLGAFAPAPYLAPYSGAKAYMLGFSRALYNEMHCENRNVDVVCMVPGQVVSGMNEGPPTTMMPMAEAWVKAALASLAPGFFSKRPAPVIVPHGVHSWAARAMSIMTRGMNDSATCSVTVKLRNKKLDSTASKTVDSSNDEA